MTSLNQAVVTVTSSGLTTATTAYTAGDTLGALNTLIIPGNLTDALILGVVVTDKSDIIGAVNLFFHDRSVTFGTDNAAPSISDADNLFAGPTIEMPPPYDLGGARRASIDSLAVPIHANVGATGCFFGVVTLTGHTFFGAVGDLQYTFFLSKDV
jgi:hypothetical protein